MSLCYCISTAHQSEASAHASLLCTSDRCRTPAFITRGLKLKLSLKGYKNIENDSHAVITGSDQISVVIAEVTETTPSHPHAWASHLDLSSPSRSLKIQLHFLMALTTSIPSICQRRPLITPLKRNESII